MDGTIKDDDSDQNDDRFAALLDGRLARIDLKGDIDASHALKMLAGDPALDYVEYNYLTYRSLLPSDPDFSQLWGLHNQGAQAGVVGSDIDATLAWEKTTGSADIVVAVIDTGMDYNHPDLRSNMWVNSAEIPDNGIDDDANGYIDDIHGINAVNGSGDPLATGASGAIHAILPFFSKIFFCKFDSLYKICLIQFSYK